MTGGLVSGQGAGGGTAASVLSACAGLEQLRVDQEGTGRQALMGRCHEAAPDAGGQTAACDPLHGSAVVIAHPYGGCQIAGEADENGIAAIL